MGHVAHCLIWDVDPVVTLWSLHIRWYGILFALGVVLGHMLLSWQMARAGHPEDTDIRLTWALATGMLIGAFTGHRLFYEWDRVLADPWSAFSLKGPVIGLSSHGATVGILFAAYLFHRWTRIPFLELTDRITFGTALVAVFVRLGNLVNSEIVGKAASVPWAICFTHYDRAGLVPRHPVQIYEALLGVVVLGLLFWADRKSGGERRPTGMLTGLFATSYFGLRIVAEFFKEPLVLSPDSPLSMGQILSFPFFLVGVVLLVRSLTKGGAQTTA
ncbi:MAG: prolipoprotein diacylglyceryl transferase [Magnetococcales bacterium]|nr:prolipoprotein diacylglyceryl transferase [Magnetococcales bacterium]